MNKRLLILGALVTTLVVSPGVYTAVDAATQQYEGIEVDLANSLAKSLGVKVEFVKRSWATLMKATLNNKFDVAMSGITRTYAREQKVFMSDGYITFGKTILMRDKDKKIHFCSGYE